MGAGQGRDGAGAWGVPCPGPGGGVGWGYYVLILAGRGWRGDVLSWSWLGVGRGGVEVACPGSGYGGWGTLVLAGYRLPLWMDKQSENITFPPISYAGPNQSEWDILPSGC